MSVKVKAQVKPEEKEKTLLEKISDVIKEHKLTTTAILDDYVADGGIYTEIEEADDNLLEKIESLFQEKPELTFEHIIEWLKDNEDEVEQDQLIELLDPDEVDSWATENGYVCVKIENLDKRDKLKQFIESEIYPHYIDQQQYVII